MTSGSGRKEPGLSATDIGESPFTVHPGVRSNGGLDVIYTKIAVDFQNLKRDDADECVTRSLESLRDVSNADAVFIALLNQAGDRIEKVSSAGGLFSQCNPEVMTGQSLDELPWLKARLKHMRILEYRNMDDAPKNPAATRGQCCKYYPQRQASSLSGVHDRSPQCIKDLLTGDTTQQVEVG